MKKLYTSLLLVVALLALIVIPVIADAGYPPVATDTPVVTPTPAPDPTPGIIDWNNLIATAIAALVVMAIKEIRAWWDTWKEKQFWEATALEDVAKIAVRYAEQTGLTASGADKLTTACEYAENWLKQRGIKVDVDLLIGMIEAKVNELYPHVDPAKQG